LSEVQRIDSDFMLIYFPPALLFDARVVNWLRFRDRTLREKERQCPGLTAIVYGAV
jgi:hypothetical protein